ncbi:MAG: hypothetical protein HRT73_07510 [Flavobacteriales bacterium]|nr:hypothetical protein [Flavobacteriales bacterium]
MSELSKIYFPKNSETQIKYLIIVLAIFFGPFIIYLLRENYNEYAHLGEQKVFFYETKFNGEITEINRTNDGYMLVVKDDTNEYHANHLFAYHYHPNDLWRKLKIGIFINKEENSFELTVDTIYIYNIK